VNAEPGQRPAADERPEDSDDEVADNTETGPLHDLTCQPAGDETDEQDDEKAFAGHVHSSWAL
jgi:hypothetical protein